MKRTSLWQELNKKKTAYPSLSEKIEVDIAIIGGGITGMTAAQELIREGKTVALIEANKIGGTTTAASTGNLYIPVQPFYHTIISKFDLKTASRVAQSRQMAIDYIEQTIHENKIDCHFARRPWYAFTQGEKEGLLVKEVEALKKMKIKVDYLHKLPFELNFKKAAVIENQARFNPFQYVLSIAKILASQGCLIYENSRVNRISENKMCSVYTENGKITAKKVIMATHTPIGISRTQLFIAPYRSYVVSAHLKESDYPDAHLWSLDTPHFAISTHSLNKAEPEILLVAGIHHKTGQGKNMRTHFSKIEEYLQNNFRVSEIAYKWSAQHYRAADNIPYIGLVNQKSKNLYIATGYFADGLVYGTLAGLIIADAIKGTPGTLKRTYIPNRSLSVTALKFIVKENLNVLSQYIQDLPLSDEKKLNEIKSGEGKIVEIKREKYAVSRDKKNQLHIVSAVCPHMKCIVNWNNAEETWDCPCHGSRFTQTGEVIEGPATHGLEKYKE